MVIQPFVNQRILTVEILIVLYVGSPILQLLPMRREIPLVSGEPEQHSENIRCSEKRHICQEKSPFLSAAD